MYNEEWSFRNIAIPIHKPHDMSVQFDDRADINAVSMRSM
jgi:hypothetical protein